MQCATCQHATCNMPHVAHVNVQHLKNMQHATCACTVAHVTRSHPKHTVQPVACNAQLQHTRTRGAPRCHATPPSAAVPLQPARLKGPYEGAVLGRSPLLRPVWPAAMRSMPAGLAVAVSLTQRSRGDALRPLVGICVCADVRACVQASPSPCQRNAWRPPARQRQAARCGSARRNATKAVASPGAECGPFRVSARMRGACCAACHAGDGRADWQRRRRFPRRCTTRA